MACRRLNNTFCNGRIYLCRFGNLTPDPFVFDQQKYMDIRDQHMTAPPSQMVLLIPLLEPHVY